MKKGFILSITLLFFTPLAFALNADELAAQKVIQGWFNAMLANNAQQASSFLSPTFLSIHTDGLVRNKSQEIELIKNLHMKSFNLSDFNFAQSNNTMVVTYKDQSKENIDNDPIANVAAGRMAILQKQNGNWLIIAYANLDQIQ